MKNAKIRLSRRGLMADAIAVLRRRRAKHIGFESRHLTHEWFVRLKADLKSQSRCISCVDWVEELRSVKTADEVRMIQASLQTVMQAFDETLGMVRPAVREIDLSAELEYRMKHYGAQKVSFDLIVASGPRSALPHGIASERRIRRNEFLVFDLGAILGGYSSDFTRTVFVGRPSSRAREIYSIVRESQECAIAGIQDGVPASQIDQLARGTISKYGYKDFFVHSTGHGIGVEVHEPPWISARSRAVLKAGQVITIEPGIYIPDYGGVRIEDLLVVRQEGCKNLTVTHKDLIIL